MTTLLGIGVLGLTSVAWLGQSLAVLTPALAVRLGVLEPEEEIDPTLYLVEAKAMGVADMAMGWILPAGALLMLLGHSLWPLLALTGGAIYLYFSALIVLFRVYLGAAGRKVGRPGSVRSAYLFSGLWVLSAAWMIMVAVRELRASGPGL